jgi:hypothetical protein
LTIAIRLQNAANNAVRLSGNGIGSINNSENQAGENRLHGGKFNQALTLAAIATLRQSIQCDLPLKQFDQLARLLE